jgi:hypothetical protein
MAELGLDIEVITRSIATSSGLPSLQGTAKLISDPSRALFPLFPNFNKSPRVQKLPVGWRELNECPLRSAPRATRLPGKPKGFGWEQVAMAAVL